MGSIRQHVPLTGTNHVSPPQAIAAAYRKRSRPVVEVSSQGWPDDDSLGTLDDSLGEELYVAPASDRLLEDRLLLGLGGIDSAKDARGPEDAESDALERAAAQGANEDRDRLQEEDAQPQLAEIGVELGLELQRTVESERALLALLEDSPPTPMLLEAPTVPMLPSSAPTDGPPLELPHYAAPLAASAAPLECVPPMGAHARQGGARDSLEHPGDGGGGGRRRPCVAAAREDAAAGAGPVGGPSRAWGRESKGARHGRAAESKTARATPAKGSVRPVEVKPGRTTTYGDMITAALAQLPGQQGTLDAICDLIEMQFSCQLNHEMESVRMHVCHGSTQGVCECIHTKLTTLARIVSGPEANYRLACERAKDHQPQLRSALRAD